MAFPSDLEIEVAFNNDIDETNYAQTGWTSILPFVASFDGDLRGRAYELDRAEAGTLNVVLDNGDGRFIPGSVGSPYYPNVKSDRRFRIRGKNMVHPNVARGGSRDHDTTGLFQPPQDATITVDTSTFTIAAKPLDSVFSVTATSEDTANGYGAVNASDNNSNTKWLAPSSTAILTYQLASRVTVRSYTIISASDFSNRDPKTWTVQGSNDNSTWSTLDTQTNQTFAARSTAYSYVIATPAAYQYYRLNITAAQDNGANIQLAEFDLGHLDTDYFLGDPDLGYYFEITKPANQTPLNASHRTVGWYGPMEYGVRLTHSVYFWRLAGTEPTGLKVKLEMAYFDSDWVEITSSGNPRHELSTLPTATVPTRLSLAHTPPATAKYGVLTFTITFGATTNSTPLTYAVTGAQSELPANLAPDISGFRDQFNWQIEGTGTMANVGTDPATSYLQVTWGADDANISTTIPHLIPGEWYSASVEAQIVSPGPSVVFSGNEGETGPVISSTSFATYSTTFQATRTEQQLQFITQSSAVAGIGLRIRKLNVQAGTTAPGLAVFATEASPTTWLRPKDIFEGWVESWPVRGGSVEMAITVVDRMKRLGEVELENTLREAIFQDGPALDMPLFDSMLDTPGRFSQLGNWADQPGGPSYVDISHQRGDLGTSTYTTNTDDGPTGDASLLLSPSALGSASVGYFLAIPYTKDYVISSSPPTPKPAPTPPPSSTYVYTKKWYATWSRTYDSDNSTRFDDSDYMYQGAYQSSSSGQRSLAGLDYKNIMSVLSGAEILEAYITVENEHAAWNKGLYAFIGTHNYSSKGSTWIAAQVREKRWKKFVAEGDAVTVNIGVTAGKEFKSGSSRGIAIGPTDGNSDNYGYFRGAKQSGRPYLTIKYRK